MGAARSPARSRCGLPGSGDVTVRSWGDGQSGPLGDSDDESHSTVPVQVSGLEHLHITAIAAGIVTGYVLTSDGFVWAWGAGNVGQLGNGGTTNSLATRVSRLGNVTVIAAGGLKRLRTA